MTSVSQYKEDLAQHIKVLEARLLTLPARHRLKAIAKQQEINTLKQVQQGLNNVE